LYINVSSGSFFYFLKNEFHSSANDCFKKIEELNFLTSNSPKNPQKIFFAKIAKWLIFLNFSLKMTNAVLITFGKT